MRKIAAISSVLCLMGIASPAVAQDEDAGYARNGWYLVLQGNYAFSNFGKFNNIKALDNVGDGLGLANIPGDSASDTWGAGLRGGYRVSEHVAAEVEFEWLHRFDLDAQLNNGLVYFRPQLGELWGFATTVNAKGYLTTGRVQPYLMGGIGSTYFESTPTVGRSVDTFGFAGRVGGGVDLYLDENIAWFTEISYLFTTGNQAGLDYMSLAFGAMLRF